MTPEAIMGVLVAVVAAIGLAARLKPKGQPPSPVFQCGRCGTAARHDHRTAEAWRKGRTRFFCRTCHSAWLQSRAQSGPSHGRESHSTRARSTGCLGVAVLFSIAPLGGLLAWAYAW